MIRFRLERRQDTPLYLQILIPIAAVIVTLILCSGLVWLSGADVVEAYKLLLFSTFQSGYDIQDTLVKASPLLFTGLAVLVAFRAKFWNIGAEGQLMAGAIAACFIGAARVAARLQPDPADDRRRRDLRRALGAAAGAPQSEAQGRRRRHHAAPELHHALRRDRAARRAVARSEERLSELAVGSLRGGVSVPALRQRPSRRAAGADRSDRRLVDARAHHARVLRSARSGTIPPPRTTPA